MQRNAAVLHVVMTFEQRHKGNEEASSADISGGRAFEADKIAEGRTVLGMFEQLQGDSEAGCGGGGTERQPSGVEFKLLYFHIVSV